MKKSTQLTTMAEVKSCFFIYLLVIFFGVSFGLVKQYFYISQNLNWSDAQAHCKTNYSGLASMDTDEEYEMFLETPKVADRYTNAWIGLHKSKPMSRIWLWTDGKQSNLFDWDIGQPNNWGGDQDCVEWLMQKWNDLKCSFAQPFFCYRILILVRENKTWEEALEYCRINYKGLATINSLTEIHQQQAKKEIELTQTESVWTGQRYLNEKWICVSGEQPESLISMPPCPDNPYRCGAHNTKTNVWENRDCREKLNFLCY